MQGEREDSEFYEDEAEAAAEEARRIGGSSGAEGLDEAERAAAEHGGGEAEGFEEAEEELEEHASHGDAGVDPLEDAGGTEAEEAPSVHGEPDELDSTEEAEGEG